METAMFGGSRKGHGGNPELGGTCESITDLSKTSKSASDSDCRYRFIKAAASLRDCKQGACDMV